MAASTANQKNIHHARSTSLPTHPLTLTVEEQLCRLRASEATSSSSSISHSLAGLKELYACVDDLLQMQFNQQALSHDGVLDGSLGLLDICSTSREILLQMKQSTQDLQSSFRRRRGDLNLTNEISAYMTSRKKTNKVICKCLGDIKRMNNKCFLPLLEKDQDIVAMVSVLREVEATTLVVFESILSFLSTPKGQSMQSSWSLVSKFLHTKQVSCGGEIEKVDAGLSTLISHKQYNAEDVKNAQKPLEALEMSFQDLEDGLECVFRCLIKTRVSLLNILNQ